MTVAEVIDLLRRRLRYLQGKKTEFDQAWARYQGDTRQQVVSHGTRPHHLEFWKALSTASWEAFDERVAGYMSPAAEHLRIALARLNEILAQASTITQVTRNEAITLNDLVPMASREHDASRTALLRWRNSSSAYADPNLSFLERQLARIGTGYQVPGRVTDIAESVVGREYTPQRVTAVQAEEVRRAIEGESTSPTLEVDRSAALAKQLKYIGAGAVLAVVLYVYWKEK